jgi:hypothetical protein
MKVRYYLFKNSKKNENFYDYVKEANELREVYPYVETSLKEYDFVEKMVLQFKMTEKDKGVNDHIGKVLINDNEVKNFETRIDGFIKWV